MSTGPGMETGETFGRVDWRGVLRRRAPAFAGVAAAVLLAAVFLAALLPNQYEGETTILIEPQAISSRLVEANLAASDLNSRLHLMTMQILSRARLSRVIDEFGLYPEESDEMTREEVIDHMRAAIRVEPVLPELEKGALRRTRDLEINTFRLFFRYPSPEIAAAVANRLANDFIDEHIRERVEMAGDTAEFIESELARLADQIRDVEARIAAVKAENAGRLPEDLATNQRLLERALDGLRSAERALAQARSDEAFYRQQAVASGASPEDAASPARRLRLLELQLAEYRSRGFTDRHPDVVAATQEIEALRARLARGGKRVEDPVSVAQLAARAEQRRAALRARAAGEEIAALKTQIQQLQERIAATPRVAEQLDALQRSYEHLRASFQEFSDKRLSASVAANMERRQKGEQFRVLEAAYPPPRPAAPNRALILVLGALLGLALGAGAALGLEMGDRSFHDARALQGALGLPVLATIPPILLAPDRRRRRRARMRTAAALAASVVLLLGGAAAGYVWVNGAPKRLEQREGGAQDPGPVRLPARSG